MANFNFFGRGEIIHFKLVVQNLYFCQCDVILKLVHAPLLRYMYN